MRFDDFLFDQHRLLHLDLFRPQLILYASLGQKENKRDQLFIQYPPIDDCQGDFRVI